MTDRRREDLEDSYQMPAPNRWRIYLRLEPDTCCTRVNRDEDKYARLQDLVVYDLGSLEIIELEEILSK